MAMTVRSQEHEARGLPAKQRSLGGQSYLTGGAAKGLRVIQLLPDQHHLSNVMSLITSSLNTQTHSPTVVGVKRLERETVYFLSNQCTHVVPIGYQAEWINGNFVNLPIGHEAQRATGWKSEKICNSGDLCSRQTPNNLEASFKANLGALEWQPYKLYIICEEPSKKKAAWSNESQEISYLEWNPDEEVECWDKVMLMWYIIPIDFNCIFLKD